MANGRPMIDQQIEDKDSEVRGSAEEAISGQLLLAIGEVVSSWISPEDDGNSTQIHDEKCQRGEGIIGDGQLPYVILIAISPIFIFALTWTVQRRKNGKRPGCPTPILVLDPCRRRWVYAMFWAMVAYESFQFFLDRNGLAISTYCFSRWQKPLILLCNVLLYAFLYYPIVGGFSTDTPIGYLISSLWTCTILGLRIWDVYETVHEETTVADKVADVFEEILPLIFIFVLALYLVIQTIITFRGMIRRSIKFYEPVTRPMHYKVLAESLYVRELFRHRDPPPKDLSFFQRLREAVTYRNIPHFRYSQTVISTVAIGFVFVYYILYGHFRLVLFTIPEWEKITRNLTDSLAVKLNVSRTETLIKIVEAYFESFIYSLVASGTFVTLLQIVLFATILPSYRRDITGAYRGSYQHILPPINAPHSYFNNAVSYAGNQTIMFAWGCLLQLVLFSVIALAISWIIVVPLIYGFGGWIIRRILDILPAFGVTLGLMIIQRVSVALFFTQDKGKTMAVENRRGYSNLAYVAFFKNLVIGLVGALLRVFYSLLFGVILFSRCDVPVINRRVERFDTSFNIYVGLIHVENTHLNPCVITFVNIVLDRLGHQRALRRAEISSSSKRHSLAKKNQVDIAQGKDDDSIGPAINDSAEKSAVLNEGFQAESPSTPTNKIPGDTDSAYGEESDRVIYANARKTNVQPHFYNERSVDVDFKDRHVGTELARAAYPASLSQASTSILMAEERIVIANRASAMRFKWFLAYTLIRNPRLIAERKLVLGLSLV